MIYVHITTNHCIHPLFSQLTQQEDCTDRCPHPMADTQQGPLSADVTKHRLASTQSRSSLMAGGECEFTHRRKAQRYSCNSLENAVVILEQREPRRLSAGAAAVCWQKTQNRNKSYRRSLNSLFRRQELWETRWTAESPEIREMFKASYTNFCL